MKALTQDQLDRFEEEGWLVVEDVLDPDRDLAPVWAEYEEVLDRLAAALCAEGRITSAYSGLPFGERLVNICREARATFSDWFDIALPTRGVEADTRFHAGPAVFALITHSGMLDVVEDLIGPEIYASPVQHVRIKLPRFAWPENVSSDALA